MDSKPPLQAKPVRRKVHVVYYLSKGGGQMDHPHLLEGYLSAAQDGLRLKDFKRWLSVLRGKSMPNSFAWSYKRTYKNGFIWHDLGENDLIQPLSKNEYVLMGSEIKEQGASVAKCKCGGIKQQAETKVVTELGDIQEEPLQKPTLRSPKVVTKSSSYNTEDHRVEGIAPIVNSPARLAMITSENKFHDSATRFIDKGSLYRGGASSRSFNDLTAQRLLEEVKRSNNHHDSKPFVTLKSFNGMSRGPNVRVSVRDCEIIAEEDCINDGIDINEHHKDGISDGPDIDDDMNGTYIVDAATQTGDSTRCSTEDHQDGSDSTGYNNMVELVNSPGGSAKLSTVRRVSSARFHHSHTHNLGAKGNLPMHFSQEFSKLPDVEKSIMMNQLSDGGEIENVGHVSSSNHTSLHNHMGSPGALSSCSAMSVRSSTRFSRQEGNRMPLPATPSSKKYGVKPDDHHRHHHSKGTCSTQHSNNASTMTSSSAPHNLLKQLLTCGNADVVTDKKPNNAVENVMVISNNALSELQTPSRAAANSTPVYQEGDKSKWVTCKQGGLMKRMSSAASSDNRSVISATASEQGSMRDAMEMISSPESVYIASHRHLKRDMIRAHSLSTSSAAAALRSQNAHLSAKDYASTPPASHRKIHHQQPSAASPGMLSVASSTSRRSSSRENEVNIVGGGDVEEGFNEALQSHHIGMRVSSKSRANKGNKNSLLINDILDRKESPHDVRDLDDVRVNTKRGRPKTPPTSVSELHKLICNPGGTPTCGNHNKVTTTHFVAPAEQNGHKNFHQHHIHHAREVYTPQHAKSRNVLIATHGTSRTPNRSSNLNSPGITYLSKSLNSPSSLFLEAQAITTPSSHGSSWKELLWSPRNGSSQKEKEKRHMKP